MERHPIGVRAGIHRRERHQRLGSSGPVRWQRRLFYQGLSAVALGGAGWLIWRRTRSAAAVAFLTVHPLVVMYLVNGGRNDILVGVALLAAVVLVSNNRPGAAGVVGALGALVKVTGVVGIRRPRGDDGGTRRTPGSAAYGDRCRRRCSVRATQPRA